MKNLKKKATNLSNNISQNFSFLAGKQNDINEKITKIISFKDSLESLNDEVTKYNTITNSKKILINFNNVRSYLTSLEDLFLILCETQDLNVENNLNSAITELGNIIAEINREFHI